MPTGPKPKARAVPRAPLTAEVPKGLKGRQRALYVRLANDLAAEGYACQADSRTVALTAKTEAHAERLEQEVAALAGLTVKTDKGERVHPLVTELRAVRAQLAGLYGQLFLSPRSRSSSRLTEAQVRSAAVNSDRDQFDAFLAQRPWDRAGFLADR